MRTGIHFARKRSNRRTAIAPLRRDRIAFPETAIGGPEQGWKGRPRPRLRRRYCATTSATWNRRTWRGRCCGIGRADDDTFPAGEIRASRRAEGAHSDACSCGTGGCSSGGSGVFRPGTIAIIHVAWEAGRGDRASSATRPQEAAGNDTKIPHAQGAREGFPVQDISPRLQRGFVGNHGMPHYRRYIAVVPLF